MKRILLAAFAFLAALSAVTASDLIYRPNRQKKDLLLRQDFPAKDWERGEQSLLHGPGSFFRGWISHFR